MGYQVNSAVIKQLLLERGMIQAELARRLDMTKGGVEAMLKRGSTSLGTLHSIASILDVDIATIQMLPPIAKAENENTASPASDLIQLKKTLQAPKARFHCGQLVPPKYFIGRENELSQAASFIRSRQHFLILGPRRVGKTSFCFKISTDFDSMESSKVLILTISIASLITVSIKSFLANTVIAIIGEVATKVFGGGFSDLYGTTKELENSKKTGLIQLSKIRKLMSQPTVDGDISVARFSEIIREVSGIASSGGFDQLVIVYDEANRLPRELSSDHLIAILEAMSTTGVTGVYVADHSMHDAFRMSSVFGRFIDMGPYRDPSEMEKLVSRYYFDDPVANDTVPVDPSAFELIWTQSQGSPFRIQLIADKMFDVAISENATSVNQEHVLAGCALARETWPNAFAN